MESRKRPEASEARGRGGEDTKGRGGGGNNLELQQKSIAEANEDSKGPLGRTLHHVAAPGDAQTGRFCRGLGDGGLATA